MSLSKCLKMFQIPDSPSPASIPDQQEDKVGRGQRVHDGRVQKVHSVHVRHSGAGGPHAQVEVEPAGVVCRLVRVKKRGKFESRVCDSKKINLRHVSKKNEFKQRKRN